LNGLAEDHVVESVVGIIDEVRVGVALDDCKAARHAGIHAFLTQLHASSVYVLLCAQQRQQVAVAAADIEHAAFRRDHPGNEIEVYAARIRAIRVAHPAMPRVRAALPMKPRSVANISGSSSRKASCPLSVLISTKLTFAATAFSACTICRLSEVGKSQSLVKETTQKRDFVPLKALASTPPK